jgi:hypothetical protein
MNRNVAVIGFIALCALGALFFARFDSRPSHDSASTIDGSAVAKVVAARARSWKGPAARGRPEQTAEGRLSGVVRGDDGKPIANARVCAGCADCNMTMVANAPRCVRTGADGRYDLEGLSAGSYFINASSQRRGTAGGNGRRPIQVGTDGSIEGDGDLDLPESDTTVSGIVIDALGGVVGGAEVRVLATGATNEPINAPVRMSIEADAAGQFSLNVPAGDVILAAFAPGYGSSVVARTAPVQGVEIVLSPASTITGQVVAQHNGQPIAGAKVVALADNVAKQEAIADEQGSFRIEGLQPGGYQLRAHATGWTGAAMEAVALDLGDSVSGVIVPMVAAVSVEGTLNVAKAPCTRGSVHVSAGGPATNVAQTSAQTNAEGLVRFDSLAPGTYAVMLGCEGYGYAPATPLEVGSVPIAGLVWNMDAGAELTLRAIDGEDRPIVGVHLSALPLVPPPEAGPTKGIRVGLTDAAGQLILKGMKPGTYDIQNSDMIEAVRVDLEPGGARSTVVRLVAMAELRVEVVRPDKTPLQGVTVSAKSVDEKPGISAIPIGGGTFKAGPMPTGSYLVTVNDGTNPPFQHPAPVAVTKDGGHVVVTYGGYQGEIAGRVVSGPDSPLRDVWVSAVSMGEPDPFATVQQLAGRIENRRLLTDGEGGFRLGGLDPTGRYTVIAERPSGGRAIVSDVAPNGPPVELLLPPTDRLSGRM